MTNSASPASSALTSWKSTMLASGVTSIILGLVLIFWPGETLLIIAALLGIGLILLGLSRLVSAVSDRDRTGSQRWLRAGAGVLYVIAGIVVLANLHASLRAFAIIVALTWIIAGLSEVFAGRPPGESRLAPVVIGLLNVVFGLVLLFWPGPTVRVIAFVAGIWLLLLGVLQIILGYRLGKAAEIAA
jgi:uncharacterized membrane protein HdeD (DUF308 family)